ncbi:MAG: hypothetical protein K8R48_01460 [Alphaproteobacteria bacterium]|nr:hypothetical protein [Alphaproteobacteria bacterium]
MGVFKKIKSLTESFTKATRRFAAVTTFGVSSVLATGTAFAQTQTAPANNNKTKTEQTSATATKLTETQRQKINEELIRQGQDQAEVLLASTEDSYSLWLDGLQKDLNDQLKESNPDGDIRVVVLDPIQMDVGLGLGLAPEKVAELMLKANGVELTPGLAADVADALTGIGYKSAAGDETYTQIPMMIPLDPDANGNQVRLIIPMSSYAPILDIPGMSLPDEVRTVAMHEGWHAMDLNDRFAGINFDNLDIDSLQTIDQKIGNIDYMKLSCAVYNSESYADVGAAGDLIRGGESIDVIDEMIAFRTANNRDAGHMAPPSLLELKKEILAMGIDNFRALDDAAALDIYNNVIDVAGLTPERLTLVYQYVQCKPDEREAFVVKNQSNPDFDVAFAYINSFVTDKTIDVLEVPPPGGGFDMSLLIDWMRVNDEIAAWDAKTELQKRAFDIDGKITPVSYAKAYGSMMKDLNNLSKDATVYDQMLFESKIIRLKNTFFDAVATTDYVLVNKTYGVDIVATDPALQKIAAEKDKAPTKKSTGHNKSPAHKSKNFYYPG